MMKLEKQKCGRDREITIRMNLRNLQNLGFEFRMSISVFGFQCSVFGLQVFGCETTVCTNLRNLKNPGFAYWILAISYRISAFRFQIPVSIVVTGFVCSDFVLRIVWIIRGREKWKKSKIMHENDEI